MGGGDIEGHSQSSLKREETVRTQRREGREGEKRGVGRQTGRNQEDQIMPRWEQPEL